MTYALLAMGVIAAVVGVAMTIFNRQFGALVVRIARGKFSSWDAILDTKLYRPTPSGRIPILMAIGVGWIVVGITLIGATLPHL